MVNIVSARLEECIMESCRLDELVGLAIFRHVFIFGRSLAYYTSQYNTGF